MQTGCVRTGQIEMEYFSFGRGERQMVILPGIDVKSILGSAPAVERAFSDFADEYTVTVFDRRRNMPDPYSIREMAEDTAAAMRALSIADADVFGASQGGMIALWLAILSPELVHAMVLGSTAARPNPTLIGTTERWLELAGRRDTYALLGDFVDRLYGKGTVGDHREELILLAGDISDEGFERFMILARSIADFDVYDRLCEIRCPALVIGAEDDRALSGDASTELAGQLHCELYMYGREYGHCVFDEAPDYRSRMLTFFHRRRQ